MQKYIQNSDILVRDSVDEFILFNPENGALHKINPHTAFIWKCLDKEASEEDIFKKVGKHYSTISEEDTREKIKKMLKYFKDKDLVIIK